jgi:hypothetical protein
MTTQLTLPWPMLSRRAPSASSRATSADWSAGRRFQVEPVLDGLALGNLEEHQVGSDAVLRAAHWRLEAHLVLVLPRTPPAQRRFPEAGDPGRVGGVNAQALDAYLHVLIVLSRACRVQ